MGTRFEDGKGSGGVGEMQSLFEGSVLRKADSESSGEGIARAHGVDGIHCGRSGFNPADRFIEGDGGTCALGDDQGLKLVFFKKFWSELRIGLSQEGGGFVFVDDEDVAGEIGGVEIGRPGGWVDEGGHSVFTSKMAGVLNGVEGDLELKEEMGGGAEEGKVLIQVFGPEGVVGTGIDDDGIFAGFLDAEEGASGRDSWIKDHRIWIDPLIGKVGPIVTPGGVIAGAGEERDVTSGAFGSESLVGSFASEGAQGRLRDDGFSRRREPGNVERMVDTKGANDEN